jgi:hypothetical protein
MARHRVPAIEVGEHEGSRIRVGHDHLRNQRREDRQDAGVRGNRHWQIRACRVVSHAAALEANRRAHQERLRGVV